MTARLAEKLVVIGVGLIGGSCALALRRAAAVGRIVGVGRSQQNLAEALKLGVVDEVASEAGAAAEGADLVLLAMPVGQTGRILAQLAPHLGARAVVTDAGSTKGDVVAAARHALGGRLPRFVPAHPIAGAEQSGVRAATPDLYHDRLVVLTPLAETDPEAVERVSRLWQACGAQVARMEPDEHDRALAAVSHLPHLLAFALTGMIAGDAQAERLLRCAGSGFRDFTRIAASSPEMWRDICLANRAALLELLDRYDAGLEALRAALQTGDAAALEDILARASRARRAWAARLDPPAGQ